MHPKKKKHQETGDGGHLSGVHAPTNIPNNTNTIQNNKDNDSNRNTNSNGFSTPPSTSPVPPSGNKRLTASSAAALVSKLAQVSLNESNSSNVTATTSESKNIFKSGSSSSSSQKPSTVSSTTTTTANPLFAPSKPATSDLHEKQAQFDQEYQKVSGKTVGETNFIKEFLLNPETGINALVKILGDRVQEGGGECLFDLGVEDDGTSMHLSKEDYGLALETVRKVADRLECDATVLHERNTLALNTTTSSANTNASGSTASLNSSSTNVSTSPSSSSSSSPECYGYILIRQRAGNVEKMLEIRVACTGNVDAGKSTLLGVLTKGVLDDGRGRARVHLFRHRHEIESGRTSSVGLEVMGFTSKGDIVSSELVGKTKMGWDDICVNGSKTISFLDLAGHEKYLKTTVFGMTGCAPDFVMLMVGSNAGVIGMTKEHLGLALALNVPVFIVVTKVDMCPKNVLESTISQLTKILRSPGCRKIPTFINSVEDVLVTVGNFVGERICPIFQISNVTGFNLDLLRLFLNLLHSRTNLKADASQPVEYQITDTFSVPGVGTVVSGILNTGVVHVGDSLLLGPDSLGHFTPTIVKSIQRKRVNVPLTTAGQSATFALKKIKRSSIRKGMVMVSKSANPVACLEFEAEILILYHSTTIAEKYQAMVHCGCIRQTASIVGLDRPVLRTGDRARVRFRFLNPEYLKLGSKILFREGRTKGMGTVTQVFPM